MYDYQRDNKNMYNYQSDYFTEYNYSGHKCTCGVFGRNYHFSWHDDLTAGTPVKPSLPIQRGIYEYPGKIDALSLLSYVPVLGLY